MNDDPIKALPILRAVTITFVFGLLGGSACGVKAPPLPPEGATPQSSEHQYWSAQPRTAPSARPTEPSSQDLSGR